MGRTLFWIALAAVSCLSGSPASADPEPFAFSPLPRWTAEPENDQLCQAVKKECADIWKKRQEEFQIDYELLYDSNGAIVGMRIVKSSTCKPVDEYYQIFKRATLFNPKLTDTHVELAPSVKPEDVRIVKSDSTSFTVHCAR